MSDVGSVAELWRFPVKSMLGERLDRVDLTERGVFGDRAYALVDVDTGKVVSAKSLRVFPDLLGCRAAFVEAPQLGRDLPPVRITFYDGPSLISDSPRPSLRDDDAGARSCPADISANRSLRQDPQTYHANWIRGSLSAARASQRGHRTYPVSESGCDAIDGHQQRRPRA